MPWSKMTNFTVGIDSKFPLPSFERIVELKILRYVA